MYIAVFFRLLYNDEMEKRPLLLRWFASYVIVLIIPLLLSVVIYLFSYDLITRSTEKIYTAYLERYSTEIDNLVRNVFQVLDQLIINNHVRRLSFVQNYPDPYDHWAIYQLVGDLNKYLVIIPFIDDLFVVLNDIGTIVSTKGHFDEMLYYSLNYENEELDYGSFYSLVRTVHRSQVAYPAGDQLLFLRSTLDNNMSIDSVTIIAAVKRSRFTEQLIDHITDEFRPIIYVEGMKNGYTYLVSGELSNDRWSIETFNTYKTFNSSSKVINWDYTGFFPVTVLKEQARMIQLLTFIGFVISSLLGLLMSFTLSKKNYEPVKKLMSYFTSSGKSNAAGENEFTWLEKHTIESVRENQDTRLALKKYNIRLNYSQETEQKLINLIRAGDSEGVSTQINEVYADKQFSGDLSSRMLQFLAYDLVGTIIKSIGQESSDFVDDLNIEEIPPSQLPAFIMETALEACKSNQETLQSRNTKALCEKVKSYLDLNFHNPTLNISQTGYHFDISPFYLSNIFREETGQSILGYITNLRIEEGKRLLREGRNVTEIAEITGFNNSSAFIRVFKRSTGLTPGQYRKIS